MLSAPALGWMAHSIPLGLESSKQDSETYYITYLLFGNNRQAAMPIAQVTIYRNIHVHVRTHARIATT